MSSRRTSPAAVRGIATDIVGVEQSPLIVDAIVGKKTKKKGKKTEEKRRENG